MCAILNDLTVTCWGDGVIPPQKIPGITNVTTVALGAQFACARQMDGKVFCWGKNSLGQCEQPKAMANVPTPTLAMTYAYDLVAGKAHVCARSVNNNLVCWGDNTFGQLDGVTSGNGPVLTGAVATLLGGGRYHSCALESDGEMHCWGTIGAVKTDQTVTGFSSATQITGGLGYVCAITSPTVVTCSGANSSGTLGQGDTSAYSNPVAVKW